MAGRKSRDPKKDIEIFIHLNYYSITLFFTFVNTPEDIFSAFLPDLHLINTLFSVSLYKPIVTFTQAKRLFTKTAKRRLYGKNILLTLFTDIKAHIQLYIPQPLQQRRAADHILLYRGQAEMSSRCRRVR